MSKTYSIGETAEIFGVPTSTLRYYEQAGLLVGVERSEGGARRFSEYTLRMLRVIECLKVSGLSLKEIRRYIELSDAGDSTIDERLKLFNNRRDAVQKQIEELEQVRDVLDYKKWYYETAEKLGSTDAVENLPLEQVPERLRKGKQLIEQVPGPRMERCAL